MENNFNLKKFLVENKLTTNSRLIKEGIGHMVAFNATPEEVDKNIDIFTKAAERKKGEEMLYREEKYAEIYEINMLRCIFCGLCEEACPKDAIYLTLSKELVPSQYKREDFIFGKDKLVMPMDVALANSKKA